jgi:hypothetical protein
MRKMLMAGVLAGAMMFAPGLTPEARASHGWLGIGTAFRVGAAHIAFIFGTPFGYEPAYYFRYDRPIRYSGHHCSRYCFRDGGYYYHHESCPLVGAHFRNYGVDPYQAFARYAPRFDGYDGGYGGGYYDDGGYDRYGGGYDRYDGRDRYDRYDRRDRRSRHRHHRGCGHY